jgi:hypothetical protein
MCLIKPPESLQSREAQITKIKQNQNFKAHVSIGLLYNSKLDSSAHCINYNSAWHVSGQGRSLALIPNIPSHRTLGPAILENVLSLTGLARVLLLELSQTFLCNRHLGLHRLAKWGDAARGPFPLC